MHLDGRHSQAKTQNRRADSTDQLPHEINLHLSRRKRYTETPDLRYRFDHNPCGSFRGMGGLPPPKEAAVAGAAGSV